MDTVWVFGDQLNLQIGALATVRPGSARVLMIESASKLTAAPWHVQRAHFLITSMRRFASEVAASGFEVDYRQTATFVQGLAEHRAEFSPSRIVATEPNSHRARSLALGEDVVLVRSNQFLCHYDDFAVWARSRKHLRLEDFYRLQRGRLDYLMSDDGPEGGRWNFDEENRQPPPRTGPYPWPSVLTEPLDALDHDVVAGLPPNCTGSPPTGLWATSRAAALRRLDHFIDHALPLFGPHEDAMVTDHFHLAHSMLSPYLNNGVLSTYCKGCSFDPKKRVGEDACPFTTLYWDFILRHADRFEGNHRMVRQVRAAERLSDRSAVRLRATEALTLLDEGRL
jgi:deoxyribodipyrimidine photolyase-related protein